MFTCCVNTQLSEPAEVVKTEEVLGRGGQSSQEDDSQELFALFTGRPPLPPPPSPPGMSSQWQSAKRSQKADPMDESTSCSTAALNSDTTGTSGSGQSTASGRLSRFNRYNPDDVPVKQISFELGQEVGYQGFLGVTVRRISPPEQGFQTVVINIPGVGDKRLSMVDLAKEDYEARRSGKKLQMRGMSKEEKLQAKVREFTSQAVQGMRVNLIDVETRLLSQSLFMLDRHMTRLSLRLAFGDEQTFRIKDLRSLAKGEQFQKMVPNLNHLASQCLAMEFASDPRHLQVFFFEDSDERDEFHLSMKVVRAVASSGQD